MTRPYLAKRTRSTTTVTRGFTNPSHHMRDLMFEIGGTMQGKYPNEVNVTREGETLP